MASKKMFAMVAGFYDKLTAIRELRYLVLVLLVVAIANMSIYWLNILIQDDYYYGLYRWRELNPFPLMSQETYWFVNRSLCWIAGNVNVYLARSVILVCMISPCAILLYSILRKLDYPIHVALFTATMVWIFPGQIEIPLFVNGSYIVEAMLVMLLSFWSGLTFLEDDSDGCWKWFFTTLFFQFWALNISELIVPCTVAIIFCYLCRGKFAGKSWVLSAALSVLTLFHTYSNILHGGRGMIHLSRPLTYKSLGNTVLAFIDWCLPPTFISYFDDNIWRKWILFVALFLLIGFVLVNKIVRGEPYKAKRGIRLIWRDEFVWRMVFPLLLFLLPLIVMAVAPWFNPRHAIFPAVGFYVCLSFALGELLKKHQSLLIGIIAVTLAGTVIRHQLSVEKVYAKSNRDHAQFVNFAVTRPFPANCQIVVTNMDVATCGHGYWSAGYLEYVLKRKDVFGLVGNELNMIDPFKPHDYFAGGMNGLDGNRPLFLFRKTDGKFQQLTYFLQWKEKKPDSAYVLYRLDAETGKIGRIVEGTGLESYAENCVMLAATKGVKQSDILWGGVTAF